MDETRPEPRTHLSTAVHVYGDVYLAADQVDEHSAQGPYVRLNVGRTSSEHVTIFSHEPEFLASLARTAMAASLRLAARIEQAKAAVVEAAPTPEQIDAALADVSDYTPTEIGQ